jgi:hypothetical protein
MEFRLLKIRKAIWRWGSRNRDYDRMWGRLLHFRDISEKLTVSIFMVERISNILALKIEAVFLRNVGKHLQCGITSQKLVVFITNICLIFSSEMYFRSLTFSNKKPWSWKKSIMRFSRIYTSLGSVNMIERSLECWQPVLVHIDLFMDVCMDVRLANAWTLGRILFVFLIQQLIHHRPVLRKSDHSSSKSKDPSDAPRNIK